MLWDYLLRLLIHTVTSRLNSNFAVYKVWEMFFIRPDELKMDFQAKIIAIVDIVFGKIRRSFIPSVKRSDKQNWRLHSCKFWITLWVRKFKSTYDGVVADHANYDIFTCASFDHTVKTTALNLHPIGCTRLSKCSRLHQKNPLYKGRKDHKKGWKKWLAWSD